MDNYVKLTDVGPGVKTILIPYSKISFMRLMPPTHIGDSVVCLCIGTEVEVIRVTKPTDTELCECMNAYESWLKNQF